MTFIDYEKAFDSIDTRSVLAAFKEGIENTYIRLLDGIYEECVSRKSFRSKAKNSGP